MNCTSKAHSDLPDLIFSAALEEDLWPEVLDRLLHEFHALHAALLIHQGGGKKSKIYQTRGNDPNWQHVFEERFHECIPLLHKAMHKAKHLLKHGAVSTGDRLLPYGEFIRTDFYRDFMRPQNLHHQLIAVLDAQAGAVSTLTLSRSKQLGAFKGEAVRGLKALVPCLRKALRVNHRMAGAGQDDIVSREVLDLLPLGVLILNSKGKVLEMNRRAVALLGEHDGLGIGPKGLKGFRSRDDSRIQGMLAEALKSAGKKGQKGSILLIPRPSRKPPYSLIFIPAESRPEWPGRTSVGCVILVSTLEGVSTVSRGILKSIYHLTEAESRFAAQLMLGLSVEESSRNLDLCVETGRTYVKRIFSKTGTRRQGELVHLLVEGPARLLLGGNGKP